VTADVVFGALSVEGVEVLQAEKAEIRRGRVKAV
jgi:hypothetical protein